MKSLLKVTRKAELGLLLVSELAHHQPGDGPLSLEEVAKKTGASRKFLEQIAADLRRAGLIEGVRGAAGGYRLRRGPTEMTVAEVFNAVEGPMELEACTARYQVPFAIGTRYRSPDVGIIRKVQGQVMATLMNTKISELA
jgi:Rrf2 family protein